MKTLAILGAALLTMSQAPAVVTITNNQGGEIDEFRANRERLEKSGVSVRIAGECRSACLLYTGMENVCLEDGALLYFHQASEWWATRWVMYHMDPELRAWVENYNEPLPTYESGEFIILSAERAVKKGMMAKCL